MLDESTAALDPIAEIELYRQINGLTEEKSCEFILTSAKIFRFLPVTCRISGRHATGRKENLIAREYITHRLAGVRFSSRILYFENGRIAEQGSCQELLEKEGRFYEFYQLQAQMYLKESM